jgi:quercetin dioxygenase-like cupin family protein
MGKLIVYAAIAALLVAGAAQSQQPPPAQPAGIKRTILQRVEIPGTSYETVLGVAELSAGVNSGRHTHPGPETGTVTEGEMILMIDGQPDKTLKAGESYQIPTGVVHDVRTASGMKVVAAYMIPKGAPLATPAK